VDGAGAGALDAAASLASGRTLTFTRRWRCTSPGMT
jgi:hypothetical protein